ncbi:DUF5106 domain-containing protein [Dysgonomonas termitidis]|uniref:DUF5106 domain-containing protein n=1 Tax=Dysgonomonas termitidis TaxID=1516126 RepID=A0ABV9KTK9_9BACT
MNILKRLDWVKVLIWVVYPCVFFVGFIYTLSTCCGCNEKKREETYLKEAGNTPVKKEFQMVTVPDGLKTSAERADYLVAHYWDHFDFGDTAYIHLPEVTEQAFADYVDILPRAGKEKAYASITAMLDRAVKEDAGGKVYPYFLSLYRHYLYDPNSPLRDEEYYIPVTEYLTTDIVSDMVAKERAKFDLSMMLKNRKGNIAADIVYTFADGSSGNLQALKNEYTLLYFYDPDCPNCRETTAYLRESSLINDLLFTGKLDILALYTDSDNLLWRKHLQGMPLSWINGYDKEYAVRSKSLYDLKAIPNLYLLDKEKRILLKDADAATVERHFEMLVARLSDLR